MFLYLQLDVLPLLLWDGNSVSITGPTGVGKTTAILIAMVEMVNQNIDQPQVLCFVGSFEASICMKKN